MRPVIGVTSYEQHATWGHWSLPAALIPLSYVRSVEYAGGRPVVIPPMKGGVEETLASLDGLVISGGADIDPAAYGAQRDERTTSVEPARDGAEFALLAAALEHDMPVLAICRGMQMLNVIRGGTLHQHIPDVVGHDGHRTTRGAFSEHSVSLTEGSKLAGLIGSSSQVKSTHHQAPARLGKGLTPVGWAGDGIVEALEDPTRTFAVGVLWHPEEDDQKHLFEGLVAEATLYRDARSNGRVVRR